MTHLDWANAVDCTCPCHDREERCAECIETPQLCLRELRRGDVHPTRDGLEQHQVWVWMQGAEIKHWRVMGTGVLYNRAKN